MLALCGLKGNSLLKQSSLRNRILSGIDARDFAAIGPFLEPINLKFHQRLEQARKRVTHIYFIEQGIVSVLTGSIDRRQIEIGLIGIEGMTGLSGLLGAGSALADTYVQVAGHGHRIALIDLSLAFEESRRLRTMLLRFVHVFTWQLASTSAANGLASLSQRMARWLLMSQDRLQDSNLPLTHELLSIMLGLHRPGVTRTIASLQAKNLVVVERGIIRILDRAGLEKLAGKFYGGPEAEFERLFGSIPKAMD